MEITVKFYGDIREKAGAESIKLSLDEGSTIDHLLIKLERRHPDLIEAILDPRTGELRPYLNVLLNGRRVRQPRGVHTKLKHKDELAIFPPEMPPT